MASEIALLIDAAGKGCLVVEKDSNVFWSREELVCKQAAGRFAEEGVISSPKAGLTAVSNIFPGCWGQAGASADYFNCVPIGETEHFVLFRKAKG